MRKLREVLRLRYELKLGYQQIGRSCAIGVGTVHKYLKRAEAAGITWPLPEDWDEARVDAMVFPRREPTIAQHNPARTPPDFAAIHEQLRGSQYVTLQLQCESRLPLDVVACANSCNQGRTGGNGIAIDNVG